MAPSAATADRGAGGSGENAASRVLIPDVGPDCAFVLGRGLLDGSI